MTFDDVCTQLHCNAETFQFDALIDLIDTHYSFSPTAFQNGEVYNAAGENNGSCKLFQFARQHGFNQEETLLCFGEHYRDVLKDPKGDSHLNIRSFMVSGWDGIHCTEKTLIAKI